MCCRLQSDEERDFANYSSAYTLPLGVLRAVPHPLAVDSKACFEGKGLFALLRPLVRAESALRTMVVALPVATPPLLEIGAMNRTKLTEWCQQREH